MGYFIDCATNLVALHIQLYLVFHSFQKLEGGLDLTWRGGLFEGGGVFFLPWAKLAFLKHGSFHRCGI